MSIKAIIFDMDGVIYRGKTIIKGARESIHDLRLKGIKTFFLTNAGTRSRKRRAEKLHELGIDAKESEVYTASYAVAKHIRDSFGDAKVLYVGEEGIGQELENFGLTVVGRDSETDISGNPLQKSKRDEKPDFVVVGLDRFVTYDKLARAFRAIHAGAKFIATNKDPTFPVEDGFYPGAGALVEFLEYSSGVKPFMVGKPNTYMLDLILEDSGLKKNEVIIVGDRVDSDILVGKRAKIKTCLVLSGVTKKADLKKLKKNEKPDYVIDSIAKIELVL
ncbi:MAG: phosphoglycolate/pyridoxal phosphate family phosphatase [Candidatus Micrarchaeia archaeon]